VAPYLFRIKSFLSWWLEAVDEHSLHSPFFFDLYSTQIKPRINTAQFSHIEVLRRKLLDDQRMIPVDDLGSGHNGKGMRKISAIAKTTLSTARFSGIYLRLAQFFDARSIVELGTAFGINTLYLAEKKDAAVTTFEGSPAIADIAAITFEFAAKSNIRLVQGNIDKTLPAFLLTQRRLDFAFVDANHTYDATLRYFEWFVKKMHDKSILVLDDIHNSKEMQEAWAAIKNHRLVYATADLFRCGIVFFDPSLNKQHVILQV